MSELFSNTPDMSSTMSMDSNYTMRMDTRAITHAVQHLLYATNPHVMAHFNKTRKNIPTHMVHADSRIIQILVDNEPGPRVDYDNLRANLTELAPFIVCTENGFDLFGFFHTLLKASEAWLDAAVEYHSFMSFYETICESSNLVSSPLLTSRDSGLYLSQPPEVDALDEFIVWGTLRKEYFGADGTTAAADGAATKGKAESMDQLAMQLLGKLKEKSEELEKLKLSGDMWRWSNTLWNGILKYDSHLWKKEAAAKMTAA